MAKIDTELITEDVYKENHEFLDEKNIKFIENEFIKLGFNMELGGAITYFSEHGKENMINSHDWGRQIQMSYYSGPSPFSPKGVRKREEWKGFCWNPIQSGDCYFNKSKVIDSNFTKNTAYIKCIPMQWALENYPGDCTFEIWAKLNDKTVDFTCRLNNDREDKNQYKGSVEAPAVYTTGKYYKCVSYVGEKPFTNDNLTELCNKENRFGWVWLHEYTPEHWSALVDDDNYGLGVFSPRTTYTKVGFTPTEDMGVGGPKDNPTGYIAPILGFVCDYNVVHTYNYTLMIGSLDEIRTKSYELAKNLDEKKYVFNGDRHNFSYVNGTDSGYPIKDCLDVEFKEFSQFISPFLFIDKSCKTIEIEMCFDKTVYIKFGLLRYDGLNERNVGIITEVSRAQHIKGTGKKEKYVFNIFEEGKSFHGFNLTFNEPVNVKIYSVEIK